MPGVPIPYSNLPVLGSGLRGHDETRTHSRGTLSFISAANVVTVSQTARSGMAVPLTLEGDQIDAATWDSLAAIIGGENVSSDAVPLAGTEHWSNSGTAGRGVVLDVTDVTEGPISAGHLRSAARKTGIKLGRGDVMFLHTGWLDRFLSNPSAPPPLTWLVADHETAQFLWDTGISAVGTDGPRTEFPDTQGIDRPLSYSLGLAELDLLHLGRLADVYELHRRYEFLFIANPTKRSSGMIAPTSLTAIL